MIPLRAASISKCTSHVSSQATSRRLLHSSGQQKRSYSSVQRPYRFHVAAAWAGKPPDPRGPRVKSVPFPPESAIGKWRDVTLARPNVPDVGSHIGEDAFYIQDVCVPLHIHLRDMSVC